MTGNDDAVVRSLSNGVGAAAVLAAGIGSFALGIIAFAADKAKHLANLLNLYRPTGPLSGVSAVAIVVWLLAWVLLHFSWRGRDVNLRRSVFVSFTLLAAGILLTFPPFADLL